MPGTRAVYKCKKRNWKQFYQYARMLHIEDHLVLPILGHSVFKNQTL